MRAVILTGRICIIQLLDWIPAFAGMTLRLNQRLCRIRKIKEVPVVTRLTTNDIQNIATQLADSLDAEVIVLSVSLRSETSQNESIFRSVGEETTKHKVELDIQYANGSLLDSTIEFAEKQDIDLIVMGASDGSFSGQFSVSDFRNRTSIPILLIPFPMYEENCV